MGIYAAPRYGSFDTFPHHGKTKKCWDPIETLQIINPDRNSLTCVGYAPTCRRRCRNPINQGNRASAFQLLKNLEAIDPSTTDIRSQLRKIAGLTLCLRYHQDQVDEVVEKWTRALPRAQPSKAKADSSWDSELNYLSESELERIWKETLRRKREREEEKNRKSQDREREEKERQEREKKKREDKQREKEEQKKREEAREREKREKEAREREEREKRERKERAQRAREEQERKAREKAEKAEKERDEWDKIWLSYIKRWDELKKKNTKGTSAALRAIIPWPVKSGHWQDVTETAVVEFFQKALPANMDPDMKFKNMQMECLKWHTDRIPKMIDGEHKIEDKVLHDLFKVIAQVVIKIRAEARSSRNN